MARKPDGYPYFIKTHLIIPFIWLKTGNNSKSLFFAAFPAKTPFWVMNNVLSSFIMPQCHMSNYSCSRLRTIAILQNEGTFARVEIETQPTYWLIFWQIVSNIFYQRLKHVLFLKLSNFSQSFEYSRLPIRAFAECRMPNHCLIRNHCITHELHFDQCMHFAWYTVLILSSYCTHTIGIHWQVIYTRLAMIVSLKQMVCEYKTTLYVSNSCGVSIKRVLVMKH